MRYLVTVNMKTNAPLMLALLAAAVCRADVPAPAFDHYQGILDRKPFGDLPPPVVAQPTPGPPPEPPAKYFRLCSIVQGDDGTLKVGFIDSRGNKAVILQPGETDDGLKLLEANYEKENATVELGTEIQILDLKSGNAAPAVAGQPPPMITAAAPQVPAPPQQSIPTYAERRRQRLLEQNEPAAPPQPKYTGEALQQHLKDYNMEVIRQGLPPLPIPLTPEQDAQLVKEGVLPAQ